MGYKTEILSNGIRLIHKEVPNRVAHCGILVNAGSRDELPSEHGLAHFIEHVIFKGTSKRKAYHILSRMEDVGGEIDAFTTKENTFISSSFLVNHYDRAIDLLSDILFNSTFPDKELAKEKEVVLDEINSYKDSPAELIFDDFEEMIFDGHPLGKNILGTKKTINKFNREDILKFIARNYHTTEIVLTSIGNIPFSKAVKTFKKYFADIPKREREQNRFVKNNYKPVERIVKRKTYQSHCIIGNEAYPLQDKKRITTVLLNNIIGGSGLNSRLNMILREKYGLVYNTESLYTPYTDTGIINIYLGTDKENLNRSIDLVHKELKLLRTKKLGVLQLHKAKQQIIGHIAISADNNANFLYSMAKSYLLFGKFDTLEELAEKIENISSADILDAANVILNPNQISTLIYK